MSWLIVGTVAYTHGDDASVSIGNDILVLLSLFASFFSVIMGNFQIGTLWPRRPSSNARMCAGLAGVGICMIFVMWTNGWRSTYQMLFWCFSAFYAGMGLEFGLGMFACVSRLYTTLLSLLSTYLQVLVDVALRLRQASKPVIPHPAPIQRCQLLLVNTEFWEANVPASWKLISEWK